MGICPEIFSVRFFFGLFFHLLLIARVCKGRIFRDKWRRSLRFRNLRCSGISDAKMIRVTTLTGAEFQVDRVLRMDSDRDLALISLKEAAVSLFKR
jgi:hypothetical protein